MTTVFKLLRSMLVVAMLAVGGLAAGDFVVASSCAGASTTMCQNGWTAKAADMQGETKEHP
jgi:hypothetical protein